MSSGLSAQTVRGACPPNSQRASGSYHAHRDGKRGRVWVRAVVEGGMSALGPIASLSPRAGHFRFAPNSGHVASPQQLTLCANSGSRKVSFDHGMVTDLR